METPFDRATGNDCAMWVADWIVKATGTDPAADLRGTYTNEIGALRQIIRWGGYVPMWRVHMAMAGFNTTTFPQEGDVGVVLDAAGQTVSAIRFDDKWAAKTTGGIIIEDFRMLVAWSLQRG
jgi:hypothetical protein